MPEGMRHQAERHRAGRRAQVEGAVVERLGAAELPGLRQVDGEGVERRVDETLRGAEEEAAVASADAERTVASSAIERARSPSAGRTTVRRPSESPSPPALTRVRTAAAV